MRKYELDRENKLVIFGRGGKYMIYIGKYPAIHPGGSNIYRIFPPLPKITSIQESLYIPDMATCLPSNGQRQKTPEEGV